MADNEETFNDFYAPHRIYPKRHKKSTEKHEIMVKSLKPAIY